MSKTSSKPVNKSVKPVSTTYKKETSKDSPFYKYQNYIYIGIIIAAVLFFFREGVFGGKIFASPDNLSPFSFKTFLEEAKNLGIYPLWVPYIFGGMPSLGSLTAAIPSIHSFFSYVWDGLLKAFAGDNLFLLTLPYYLVYGIALYLYARTKFESNITALYCALAGVFATGIIQLIIVGHHTKMMTFAFFPLILLIIDRLIETDFKDKLKFVFYLGLLAIISYIQLHFHHIQMLFYSYLMIGLYFSYIIIYKLIKKLEVKNIVRALIIFIAAVIVSVAMDADIIMTVREYNKYSIRGQPSIENIQDPNSEGAPLSYEYATNWSFSPGEVLTFIIPYYYGFGDVEIKGERQNTYWGQMPFTDSPVYFGVITLALAVIGIAFNFRKNASVQALTFIAVFFLVLSFGRNLSILYDFFYNYVPFFSSFRAPVMIHYYMDLAFVILAGFGFKTLLEFAKDKTKLPDLKKASYVLFGIAGLMFLISIFGFENSYKNSVTNGPKANELKQSGQYNPQQINQHFTQVAATAYENVISDIRIHAIFLAAIGGLILLYGDKKMQRGVFTGGIIALAVIDLWMVSSSTLHWDTPNQKDAVFAKTDYVNWTLNKEPNTHLYRVAEVSRGQLATGNHLAYYKLHQFNGYQGAKIRNYQDAIDIAGGLNPALLSLGNVRYIFSDTPVPDTSFSEVYRGSKIIYENKAALPRAYFVKEVKKESGLNILNSIKQRTADFKSTAFVEKDIPAIQPADSSASAVITHFDIHNITYDVTASGNNFLALSEIYYPAGWKAYIDGNETEIYKTNYVFRGVIIPAGKHKLELKFEPETYFTGKAISTIANVLAALMLISGIVVPVVRKKNTETKDRPEAEKI